MKNAVAILGIVGSVVGFFVWFWTMSNVFGVITFLGFGFLALSFLIPEKRYVFHPIGFRPPV